MFNFVIFLNLILEESSEVLLIKSEKLEESIVLSSLKEEVRGIEVRFDVVIIDC